MSGWVIIIQYSLTSFPSKPTRRLWHFRFSNVHEPLAVRASLNPTTHQRTRRYPTIPSARAPTVRFTVTIFIYVVACAWGALFYSEVRQWPDTRTGLRFSWDSCGGLSVS